MKAYLFKNYDNALNCFNQLKGKVVTIECEWGDRELNGVLSLKHHGRNQANIAPSAFYRDVNYTNINNPTFLLSHLDADAIFGAMWVMGIIDRYDKTHIEISRMVEKADILGPHFIMENWNSELFKKWIVIGWIINRNNVTNEGDITELLKEIIIGIKTILNIDNIEKHPLYSESYEWFTKIKKNAEQYIDVKYKFVTGFVSSKFMLSNYYLTGKLKPFLIQYHPKAKRITISAINDEVAKYVFGENGLVSFMQEIFGSGAGGKVSIAGTPKSKEIKIKDYNSVKKILRDRVAEKLTVKKLNELVTI